MKKEVKRVLILSDSHGYRGKLDSILMHAQALGEYEAVIHLGDGMRDMEKYREFLPVIYQVPGNCDGDLYGTGQVITINGVRIYMTHGHALHVKSNLYELKERAYENRARIALYGHTHRPFCEDEMGLMVLNPGAVMNGQFAVLEIGDDIGAVLYP